MSAEARFAVFDAEGPIDDFSRVPIDALSLGEGVFETVLVLSSGRPVFPERHRRRLAASCSALGIACEGVANSLFQKALDLCGTGGMATARLRVAVFAGSAGVGPVALAALRSAAAPPATARLCIAPARRSTGSLQCVHKTSSYIENLIACRHARADGFHDALWLDERGYIAETSTANIFFHADARLLTPAEGALLPGIVRNWIIEKAGGLGIEVSEEQLPADAAGDFEYAFITNSIIGIVPVIAAGGVSFADPRGERWFRDITGAYADALKRAAIGS